MAFFAARYWLSLLVLLSTCSEAQTATTLTGEWGGGRSFLTSAGIDLAGAYISEIDTNPRGGTSQQVGYVDQWSVGATLDLQKLLAWRGAHFQITITDRNGNVLNNKAALGTLQEVQDMYNGLASKVYDVLSSYAQEQGFTLVLDGTANQQQAPVVLYASPSTDISKAIVDAYNLKSGVPAPPPQPESAPAPKPAAPKPPAAH